MKLSKVKPLIVVPAADQLGENHATTLNEVAASLDDSATGLDKLGLTVRGTQARVLSNNLISIADAIADGDATIAMFKEIEIRVDAFDKEVANINSEIVSKSSNKVTGEFAAVTMNLEEVLAKVDMDQAETAAARGIAEVLLQLSNRNKMLRRNLPKASVKDYSLVRLPVVVVLGSGFFDKNAALAFKRAGFDTQDFQGYPQIEDQVLLAVRQDYARAQMKDQSHYPIWDMAVEIVNTINATTGADFNFVSEESRAPRDDNKKFAYYWLCPDPYYTRLLGLLGAMEGWDIAV